MKVAFGDLRGPLTVQWELTHACTNQCIFCHNPEYEPITMGNDLALKIMDALLAAGVFHITFTGGEPVLHPLLPELISVATMAGVTTAIITNGNRHSRDALEELKRQGLSGVQISLHSHDPAIHGRLTNNSDSHAIALHTVQKALSLGLKTNINTVITSLNPQLMEMYRFVHSLGVTSFTLTRYIPTRPTLMYLDPPFQYVKEELCRMISAQLAAVTIKLLTPFPLCALESREIKLLAPAMVGCDGGKSWVTISPQGYVKPCPPWDYNCGSLEDRSLESLWATSEQLTAIRNDTFIPAPCKNCSLQNRCSKGCRSCALAAHKDATAMDPLANTNGIAIYSRPSA